MTSETSTPPPRPTIQRRPGWRQTWWAHPELTLAGVALLAWVGVFALSTASATTPHMGMTHHEMGNPGLLRPALLWIAMATAMMLPTVLVEARFIALNGRWSRRQRGPALFALAYLTVWSAAGVVLLAALRPFDSGVTPLWAGAATFALAAAWEATRWKRHLLLACHQLRSIPPTGGKADRACLTEGARKGITCLGACGPMTLPMLVAPHEAMIWLMIPLAGVIGVEKVLSRGIMYVRHVAAGLAVTAQLALALALLTV
jgi:predicted metal-binding membrane protein